jgi:dihydroflavonol-4-reductase
VIVGGGIAGDVNHALKQPPSTLARPAVRAIQRGLNPDGPDDLNLQDPILVTGATGFVGSAVARALVRQGATLRVLVRRSSDRSNLAGLGATEIEGDLTDPASLRRAVEGCRYLFHVAADYRIWVPDPDSMLRANVAGTRTLMLAAREAGVERVVYCSSVAALGLTADGTPADETTPVSEDKVVGIYKKSKYRAEQAVLDLVREGLPAVIVNPSTPVGPRDIKPTPTGRMIADAAAGRMPAYIDTGLNIVHVDDVAEGHLLALRHGRFGERYILGSENLGMAELLALVAQEAGRTPPRLRLPNAALWPVALACEGLARVAGIEPLVTRDHLRMARKRMFFSSAKAMAELGYAPRPARAAIADAIAWFRARGLVTQ